VINVNLLIATSLRADPVYQWGDVSSVPAVYGKQVGATCTFLHGDEWRRVPT
jgi:hypothetical protein